MNEAIDRWGGENQYKVYFGDGVTFRVPLERGVHLLRRISIFRICVYVTGIKWCNRSFVETVKIGPKNVLQQPHIDDMETHFAW